MLPQTLGFVTNGILDYVQNQDSGSCYGFVQLTSCVIPLMTENEIFYGTMTLVLDSQGRLRHYRNPPVSVSTIGYTDGWWIRPGEGPLVEDGTGWRGPYETHDDAASRRVYP